MTNIQSHFLSPLIAYINSFAPVSPGLIKEYNAFCQPLLAKKNKFILSPLDYNASVYFLTKGLVRGFIRDGDKDITTWFSTGNEIIGAIRDPEGPGHHSLEYLQALEDCELIEIPYTLIESTFEKFPEGPQIGRKLFALKYYAASERAFLARIPNAADRYHHFLKVSNLDLNRIPIRHLSSYLGMRLETLSRIRGRKD
ncbi:Crp/Fnr family transcriptional regulator [Pedobacter endophyticus]|uniref:Crp/Fnr family transcriptional regulator n=1 Tax=Pedobacter endophyticus TaxID=2789740 RepID=A0A7S9KZ77_9SPHI|nr:Crp/Fnr family transcriptional regulator [Pedobacter endophyticus]QPH39549.1 Crp/Fnr family transcriptional regulator [Pedobacter endophyticus]